jgi:hypothetical protein
MVNNLRKFIENKKNRQKPWNTVKFLMKNCKKSAKQCKFYNVGSIRELSVFEEGQVSTQTGFVLYLFINFTNSFILLQSFNIVAFIFLMSNFLNILITKFNIIDLHFTICLLLCLRLSSKNTTSLIQCKQFSIYQWPLILCDKEFISLTEFVI